MDVAIVALTAALVLTTAVYAYFTWRMADEMQKSRLQTLRPRLGLLVRPYGPTGGNLALRSLGPGVALDVAVTLTFEPSGQTREWHGPVFPPGEEAEFFFPGVGEGQAPGFDELEKRGVQASLNGSMHDVAGNVYEIGERLDVAAWSKVLTAAQQAYVESPAERVAAELKKIRETFQRIRSLIERWRK